MSNVCRELYYNMHQRVTLHFMVQKADKLRRRLRGLAGAQLARPGLDFITSTSQSYSIHLAVLASAFWESRVRSQPMKKAPSGVIPGARVERCDHFGITENHLYCPHLSKAQVDQRAQNS
jgi:hypothetical protein